MKECSNAELIVKSISCIEAEEKQRIMERFKRFNIESKRITVLDWSKNQEEHFKVFNIDVSLDPFPYGGATSTCESLIMGVPVICLSGNGIVGQLGASILRYSEQYNNIAKNKEEYISKAIECWKAGLRSKEKRLKLRKVIKMLICVMLKD